MPNTVFLSYSRKDEAFARQLATSLDAAGVDVWLDSQDIPPGVKWSSAIAQGLDTAQTLIVILSPDAMASTNVEDEWQYFLDKRKRVLPVLWRPTDIHFQLNRLQYILFHQQPYDTAFARLLDALNNPAADLPRPITSTITEYYEEQRRLDAAMPRQVTVNQPTEVWAQICLLDSEGFRAKLPHFTPQGDVINQADVRENSLTPLFPIDPLTGKPLPLLVRIEVRGTDFSIADSFQDIKLLPGADSGLLVYSVTAQTARARSLIQVIVKSTQPGETVVTLGSASLAVEIEPVGVQRVAKVAWGYITARLGISASAESAPSRGGFGLPAPAPAMPVPASPAPIVVPPPMPEPMKDAKADEIIVGLERSREEAAPDSVGEDGLAQLPPPPSWQVSKGGDAYGGVLFDREKSAPPPQDAPKAAPGAAPQPARPSAPSKKVIQLDEATLNQPLSSKRASGGIIRFATALAIMIAIAGIAVWVVTQIANNRDVFGAF
ncbi:MAG: toll/interleukin-1 receptor domain-containing protein [Armatimonadetes bacterium]|nr:toll/interleukin-1 receptor domain-containing protein [Anaerolineae bacterium]